MEAYSLIKFKLSYGTEICIKVKKKTRKIHVKNCPDLPIIRCFTLGIEPENPLQSGTGITTEAAGLLEAYSPL